MKNYKEMTRQELGEAYDNTSAVKNSPELLAIYEEKSEQVRKNHKLQNIKYGNKERQNVDYFHIADNAPLFLFIHGGYWQMRRKETFHFIVDLVAKKGYNIAFAGYTLAPESNIASIEKELALAIKTLRSQAKEFLFDAEKITLSGWSAGGHLAAELLKEEGIVAALAISGIYDLEPISLCFLNDKLNLSTQDILDFSPMRKSPSKKKLNLVYGENELAEIIRQSKEYHAKVENSTLKEIPKANHFSILLKEITYASL